MEVKIYRIKGRFRIYNIKKWQKFSILIRALKEEHALEKLYSLLGGNHNVKRNLIKIDRIEEVSEEELKQNPNLLVRVR